jgi:hypothetical protein
LKKVDSQFLRKGISEFLARWASRIEPAGQQAIFCCPIFSACHAGHRCLQPVTQMSTAPATAATGEMHLDIIDEQPRTVVAFKFKGPLPGFRDVDKPELDQSVTKKQ